MINGPKGEKGSILIKVIIQKRVQENELRIMWSLTHRRCTAIIIYKFVSVEVQQKCENSLGWRHGSKRIAVIHWKPPASLNSPCKCLQKTLRFGSLK